MITSDVTELFFRVYLLLQKSGFHEIVSGKLEAQYEVRFLTLGSFKLRLHGAWDAAYKPS